jgi:hypothetical protein
MRRQFLAGPGSRIELHGVMRRVWHRPSWLGLLLWLASRGGLLFPEQGTDIPVKLTISCRLGSDGRPVQTWSRRFRFHHLRRFDTLVSYDPARSVVVDRLGPGRLLAMESVMAWRGQGEVVMSSIGWSVRASGIRLGLPEGLLGRVTGVQSVEKSSRMKIAMRVSHFLLGDVFGYDGTVEMQGEGGG